MRLSPCVLVQTDGWARGEREGYGEPCDVTSLSLSRTRELGIETPLHTNKNYTRELGLWSFRPTIAFTSPKLDGGS